MADDKQAQTNNPKGTDRVVRFGNVPTVDLQQVIAEPDALQLIPETAALRYNVLPVSVNDDTLTVVADYPDDLQLIDTISRMTNKKINMVIPLRGNLHDSISTQYKQLHESGLEELSLEENLDEKYLDESVLDIIAPMELIKDEEIDQAAVEAAQDAPIIKAVDMILTQAVRERASDIHIAPEEKTLKIRYRVDGVLHDSLTLPPEIQSAILTRIKILANMNIAERRRPQDGSFTGKIAGKTIDFRVGTIGTNWGEYAVLRVLDKTFNLFELENIGMPDYIRDVYAQCLAAPFGMIIISGPTGSGKTTTLYASLLKLNSDELNIMSIEDPVEYKFKGVRQIQVNRAANITFAAGLRACMRMDPDVILVGEIRDQETAETAVNAALTGHLVLTSIHANDAVGALVRLIDLGVEPFLVTSAVIATASQRLVRKICPKCGELKQAPLGDSLAYKQVTGKERSEFTYGAGCNNCNFKGYRGRIGVFEVLPITDPIRSLVVRNASAPEIKDQAMKEGMLPMRHHGMGLAKEGVTTPGEVARHVFTIG